MATIDAFHKIKYIDNSGLIYMLHDDVIQMINITGNYLPVQDGGAHYIAAAAMNHTALGSAINGTLVLNKYAANWKIKCNFLWEQNTSQFNTAKFALFTSGGIITHSQKIYNLAANTLQESITLYADLNAPAVGETIQLKAARAGGSFTTLDFNGIQIEAVGH